MDAASGSPPARSVAGWLIRCEAASTPPRRGARVAIAYAERRSALETEAKERAHGADAVAPGDLLALGVRAPEIADRNLVQAHLALAQDLGRQLGLDREVVGDEVQRTHEITTERLVADLHVGDRRVEQHVREEREEAVAGVVPEQVRALGLAAPQARAEHHVGVSLENWSEQSRQVAWVVLQVGVLDHHDVAARGV